MSWLRDLGVAGVEGIVIKPVSSAYRPGAQIWTKVRARDTAEYIIGGVTGTLDRPATLLLGRFDDHKVLRYAGQTHPVKAAQRQDVAHALRGLPFRGPAAGHPWPCPLPPAWAGTFADWRPLPFIPVEPTVVAEVEVDTALDGPFGRVRHRGRLVRLRLDLHPEDVTTGWTETQQRPASAGASGTRTGSANR